MSLIFCLFWLYTAKWSVENMIRIHSYSYVLGEFVLAWSPQTYENTTDYLLDTFRENDISPMTLIFAIPGILISFFGHLQDTVMCDVVILITMSLYQTMIRFVGKLETNGNDGSKREDTWRQYESVKLLAQEINSLLEYMLIITYFYTVLQFFTAVTIFFVMLAEFREKGNE